MEVLIVLFGLLAVGSEIIKIFQASEEIAGYYEKKEQDLAETRSYLKTRR
jgi:hypothetical protein